MHERLNLSPLLISQKVGLRALILTEGVQFGNEKLAGLNQDPMCFPEDE
jgi:hypothetical protein